MLQLSKFLDNCQDYWDQCVPLLLMAYRTSMHKSTGCTPAMMMMGLPIDLIFGCLGEPPMTYMNKVHVATPTHHQSDNSGGGCECIKLKN